MIPVTHASLDWRKVRTTDQVIATPRQTLLHKVGPIDNDSRKAAQSYPEYITIPLPHGKERHMRVGPEKR